MQGTVQRIPDNDPGVIESDDGRQFHFDSSAVSGSAFSDLSPGMRVAFVIEEQAGGSRNGPVARAVNVSLAGLESATESRQAAPARSEKTPPATSQDARPRGGDASATGTGQATGMAPPPGIEDDKVDEASWESFPASDPPAYTRG